jgi:AraC-like DNA-binding protein
MGNSSQKIVPLIRMGHLLSFTAFCSREGAPFEHHLQSAGLPLLCDDPDHFVPLRPVWSCFANMAEEQDPLLGWRVGKYVGDENINHSLLAKIERAPTLYQALHTLFLMLKSETTELHMGIYELLNDVLVYMCHPANRGARGYHEAQAYQISVILDLICHFLGPAWSPEIIGIESRECPPALHEYFPRTRILTQRVFGYIQVPRKLLYTRARALSSHGLDEIGVGPNEIPDFITALRLLITSYLPDGYPPAAFAANLLEISERTLARRLADYGVSYGALVDELRFERSKQLLEDPHIKLTEVANSIGFRDQSNFTRMFKRISGMSPLEYRKHRIAEA